MKPDAITNRNFRHLLDQITATPLVAGNDAGFFPRRLSHGVFGDARGNVTAFVLVRHG